jgi:hypothetical protein
MATRKQSRGVCTYCGKEASKAAMTKHLPTCSARQDIINAADKKQGGSELIYHLRVQDAYSKDFWLDLEVRGSKKLEDLDDYLRSIWLECCGHMSQFFLGGPFSRQIGMKRTISEVFAGGAAVTHIYDMGTSSETVLTCVGVRQGKPTTAHPIALLARNLMPEYPCIECDKTATHLCIECIYQDTAGTLCAHHAKKHPHTDYGSPMVLVNSPRMGMCGYGGPAEPPY